MHKQSLFSIDLQKLGHQILQAPVKTEVEAQIIENELTFIAT
jgi:hypothetical protein